MSMPQFTGVAHIAFTVVDMEATAARREQVFGFERTGLDHVSLTVAERADLDRWVEHLRSVDVEPSPVRDAGNAEFISFTDPDGIQGELWWPGPG